MELIVRKSFVDLTCANCGCLFAITEHFRDKRREDHGNFYCPMGHPNIYPGETEAERLRKELARVISQRASAEHEKQALEKKLARVKNGVCPECNRSFTFLSRHMVSKHGQQKKA